jgi:hypothetical protein
MITIAWALENTVGYPGRFFADDGNPRVKGVDEDDWLDFQTTRQILRDKSFPIRDLALRARVFIRGKGCVKGHMPASDPRGEAHHRLLGLRKQEACKRSSNLTLKTALPKPGGGFSWLSMQCTIGPLA